ncbi:MAG: transporter substrate-binding domain-containing protein [Lachnospiraceae bacterium]|nr:transporter substrate-binding domain-containing protein [Lachnospiraceae bacterium]
MKKSHNIYRILAMITSFLIVFSALSINVLSADNESASNRRVRVGWYNSDHFQEGTNSSDIKSGYSYEYLQSVANYTGWEYEYVYGSWSELYDAFIKGDIDLLAGVSYTEERAGLMNYPAYEMGYESYYIYKKAGNEEISGSDLETLKDKKVGTLKNNLMTDYFNEWLKESGVKCKEVLFDDFDERDAALEDGTIDAFIAVNNNVPSNSGFVPVVMVGQSSYYLAVTKDRTDLLQELNETLSAIRETNPYFTESLQIRYFNNTAVNAALSKEESKWVDEHEFLKVGYIDSYLPFCEADADGHVTGVITDIFDTWQSKLGLEDKIAIEYVPYYEYPDLLESLRRGEIDVAFPINDSIWQSEQEDIVQTNSLIESSIYLIYKGEYNENTTDVIAISDHSPFQTNYAQVNYPDSEVVVTDSPRACLEAVTNGDATCTFFNSGRAEQYLSESEFETLNRLSLGENLSYCIGVKKGNNTVYTLVQRGVGMIDKSTMTNSMFKYANYSGTYTLEDFIHDHAVLVMSVGIMMLGLIASIVVILAISLKKVRIQNIKEQEMLEVTRQQKEELELARDELEEAVKQAESANEAKTTFLFNMSHDVRTPMNAIMGFADLAARTPGDAEKTTHYMEKIKDSGEVLLSILNNVLEMSRIEKGMLTIEEEACEVHEFGDKLCSMFEEQMNQKNIKLIKKESITNNYIFCDIAKTREIFLNLLSNAFKYTGQGGEVRMNLKEIPSEEEGKIFMQTTIRDNGRGMSDEFLPALFDEFARESKSEGNTIQGTGLGMTIVKNLVDMMGGTIEVRSRLGIGTTCVVTLPHRIASKEDLPSSPRLINPVDFTGKRILLAEDMDINAEIAITILQNVGFEVDRAADGRICVEMLKEKPPYYYDAILMDIQMPNMNGYEASKAIRAMDTPGQCDVPIVALTANAFDEDKQNATDAGMNGHLGKPIDVDELIAVLAEQTGLM